MVSLERLWLPLARLWAPFGSLWGPFGSLWDPFGSLCCPFGSPWGPLAPFGAPFGRLWGALGALRGSLGCLRHILSFCQKMGFQFRANGSHVRSLSSKIDLTELNHRIPPIPWKCDLAGSSQPPFLAPGARMTVVKHTPSKYN